MTYRHLMSIGGKGDAPEQFAEALRGVAVDRDGRLYAVGDREVKVFDGQGAVLRGWTTAAPGHSVAVDTEDRVFVGETGQVEQFSSRGRPLATWRDPDRLGAVTEIGFAGDLVLLGDASARCIRCYDRSGKWRRDIGKNNNTRGLLIPNGHVDFRVDAAGVIHVPNPAKHRVERYALDGELLGHFGRFGTQRPEDFPGCCNPTNVALAPGGRLVVTEKAGPRLKVYDERGGLVAALGPEPFDALCKNMDVAVDDWGRIYVVDTVRLRICVFAPEAADAASRPAAGESAAR